jgi:hypothetical protein
MFWNIQRDDGGYETWVDGQREDQRMKARDRGELQRQLSENSGFTDGLRVEVFRQLASTGIARVGVPRLGQFSQL